MINVVVAESSEIARMGLRVLLRGSPTFRLLKDVSDIGNLVAELRALAPHVVLLDSTMLRGRSVGLIDEILASARRAKLRILVTAEQNDERLIIDAVRSGASGAVLKESSARAITDGIYQVACGNLVFPQRTLRWLVEAYRRDDVPPQELDDSIDVLTRREVEVVRLAASGLNNADIARHFVLSESTVKTHLNRAMRKLHLPSRAALVAFAYGSGLVRVSGA